MEMVTIPCYGCKGTGKTFAIDVEDGYGEEQECCYCKGKGEIEEPHPKYF